MWVDNFENSDEEYLTEFGEVSCNTEPVPYSLIGSVSFPSVYICTTDQEDSKLELFRDYFVEDAGILARLLLPPGTEFLFNMLLKTNYGVLGQHENLIRHHGSVYDLFRSDISDATRNYLNTRLENYEISFGVEPEEDFFTFPSQAVPYWVENCLFPIFFRSPFAN